MVKKILTHYARQLDEYLSRLHHQPEGMAEVGFIGGSVGEKPCKMVVSLLSVERETSGGIAAPVQRTSEGYVRTSPPLLLNLNLIIAAMYDTRRYTESLSVLSDTLKFIQSAPKFKVDGMDYTMEIITLSAQELNNVWTLLGGQYHPSVMCKIRRLVLDTEEITSGGRVVDKPIVEM